MLVYKFKVKQKDRLKILPVLHLLIALIFIIDVSNAPENRIKDWIFSTVYFIAFIFLLIAAIFYKKILTDVPRHFRLFSLESMLFLGGAVYFWSKGLSLVALSHAILAGVLLLFMIYLRRRENGESIVVSESNVILPGLMGQRIVEWSLLTNLIKRDDLLTLDFKNNRLIHVQVINSDDIPEDEFNQFCQQQLSKN
jgi:peptidoglycan/LPS O-acetylase OafA/YrhL